MSNKGASQENLSSADKEIASLIETDLERQNSHIHLIASENFASQAVMEASGSILTNKYSVSCLFLKSLPAGLSPVYSFARQTFLTTANLTLHPPAYPRR